MLLSKNGRGESQGEDDDVIEFVPILPDDARCEHLDASA